MKRPSKNKAAALDVATVQAIAESVGTAELSAAQRASMHERIKARLAAADQPALTQTVRGDAVEWQSPWPNVWVKVLRLEVEENIQVMLVRMQPGGVIPCHMHTKDEECVVVEGEIFMGDHRVGAGDFHIARSGSTHGDITTRTGALFTVRSEIPPDYLRSLRAQM